MESPHSLPPSSPTPEIAQQRKLRKRTLSLLFLIAAGLFTLYGLVEMYKYGPDDKVVGGDAYNYIIMAGRGTGLICAGVVSALIGLAVAVFDLTDKQS
jgi:hypothetical protein